MFEALKRRIILSGNGDGEKVIPREVWGWA